MRRKWLANTDEKFVGLFQTIQIIKTRSPPIGCAKQNPAPMKFDRKPSDVALSAVF